MSILYVSWKNLVVKPLSTLLIILLMMLGIGMIAMILQISRQVQGHFNDNVRGIDMVVGAKGSPLQLILASIYHIDNPTGNIKLAEAEKLKRNRLVASGVPLSYGDSYRGFRIVGTTEEYPALYDVQLAEGDLWGASMEVTLGWQVAQQYGLKIGDELVSAHGLVDGGEQHADHGLKVVGIFAASGSVIDHLILTGLESVWHVHDHEAETPSDQQEITAMLIKFRGPMGLIRLPRMINENTGMQAAVPSFEISKLIGLMGVGIKTVQGLGLLIMIVAGISVFISLYNAMNERSYEIALMRVYGASKAQLTGMVLGEAMFLVLIGYVLGILFSWVAIVGMSSLLSDSYYFSSHGTTWGREEWWLGAIAVLIGLVAAIAPAIRTNNLRISEVLSDG